MRKQFMDLGNQVVSTYLYVLWNLNIENIYNSSGGWSLRENEDTAFL